MRLYNFTEIGKILEESLPKSSKVSMGKSDKYDRMIVSMLDGRIEVDENLIFYPMDETGSRELSMMVTNIVGDWVAERVKNVIGGKDRDVQEAIADISYEAGRAGYYSGNTRQNVDNFIDWAEEFVTLNSDRQWDGEYVDEIHKFTSEKIEKQ